MSSRQWYYAIDGSQQGPIDEPDFFRMFLSGRLDAGTLVWTQGMESWEAASAVADLTAVVSGFNQALPQSEVVFVSRVIYAGFWKRVVASIIDSIILEVAGLIGGAIVGAVAGFMLGLAGMEMGIVQLVCSVLGFILGIVANWLYFTLMESSAKQATLGKMALGIVVTDMDGRRISFGKANGRYWAKILSALILCIGFMMAGFTEKKQGLHDILAGTLVVNR